MLISSRVKTVGALLILSISLLLSGCGYKPSSKVARNLIGQNIYVSSIIALEDPENSVLIKDALTEALRSRFGINIVKKREANSQINVSLKSLTFSPLQYDSNGYVIYYRGSVGLVIEYIKDGKKQKYSVGGLHDFSVEPNAILSDTIRFDAIRSGASKAVDAFMSKLAAKGVRSNEYK